MVFNREQTYHEASALGIDAEFISTLVETFYGRIEAHETLGPIFERAIEDWPPHLAAMKSFWSSVALSTGEYSGQPVPAHRKHLNIMAPEDFKAWLTLFRQTLDDVGPSQAVTDYFMMRAERIADDLQLALFGAPALGRPKF